MLRNFCHLIVLFTIPTVVELSMWVGVGRWGCPNSSKVSLVVFASFTLRKRAPSSASAADAATKRSMIQSTLIALSIIIGLPFWGMPPRKNSPLFGGVHLVHSNMMRPNARSAPCQKHDTRSWHPDVSPCTRGTGNIVAVFVWLLLPVDLQAC